MLSITIDEKSVSAASAGQLDLDSISNNLELPPADLFTKCVQVGEHGYILSRLFQPTDALLTISLSSDGPITDLAPEARQEALGRMMRCTTLLVTGRTRSIPVSWRAFHAKNRLSYQADRLLRGAGRTNAGRIIVELSQDSGPRIFAFLLDQTGAKDVSAFKMPSDLLSSALDGVSQAILVKEESAISEQFGNAVTLDARLPSKLNEYIRTEDWYASRLTKTQRKFVDHPLSGSVRLVGPAGTGKTVALVVKCLRELAKKPNENDSSAPRFLFLTHASATASDIENMVLGMEPSEGLELLASEKPRLVISTLYSLANSQMRYDLDDLTPVSLDGHEGRAFQADVLNEIIESFRKGDWIVFKSACSKPFATYIDSSAASTERRFFLWELLNEFACVLDAEGVRSGASRRDQYLTERRKNWMMLLPTREEREVVLSLYDGFRQSLRSMKAIGGDQMVTDFLNHLDSFRWEATRDVEGFDAIFVDELHLFNRQERMVFKNLLRNPALAPVVFMAYDAKQSPRDTFLKLPSADVAQFDFWKDAKLGKVEKIELVDVFRYTPQITHALSCIDESFPGQDLDDDWPKYSGISRIADGPIPTVCSLRSTVATYTLVFRRAKALQRALGRNKRVAVLCASNELFKRYLDFSDLRTYFHAITSRDEASGIPKSDRKFLFSMPEYVAGIQFDTVLVIDVNRDEVPDGPYATAALRKFVSQVYLGASRAERQLEFYSSEEHGGIAPMISRSVLEGAVISLTAADLTLD